MKTSDNAISRKDFIKSSALAAAGLSLMPNILAASPLFEKQKCFGKRKIKP
ncbi:Uncharacterised protein [Chryseobacterium carnipullorum]|uniref:Twin-arginine translocation signal domain-containing protein n=1 Tax=Chryseobacterium carnipullorum TaxID=1124835 RepID=A0A376DR47_CHRCU|nr:Uncharacterised protein [Chryseobacterium carnipullorum]